MNIIEQASSAIPVLVDWLGTGGTPVPAYLSQVRANKCLQCPHNGHGTWWERSTDAIAMVIRSHLEARSKMNLRVEGEENMFMCSVCGCATKLKVHVPIEHISSHLTTEKLKEFPDHCWIRHEITTL